MDRCGRCDTAVEYQKREMNGSHGLTFSLIPTYTLVYLQLWQSGKFGVLMAGSVGVIQTRTKFEQFPKSS